MMTHARRAATRWATLVIAAWLTICPLAQSPAVDSPPKRMSFQNRLLLNRAAITGLRTIEVLLAVRAGQLAAASARVGRCGGRIGYSDENVGYLRVEVPIDRLIDLVQDQSVDAYQISSLSRGAWYRDRPARADAELFRGFETSTIEAAAGLPSTSAHPALSVEASRSAGYTADDDAGLREWIARHPTYDGRGVTIAILEVGEVELTHPIMRSAKALDGTDVPKLAGILNTVGLDVPDETRVELNETVHVRSAWTQIANRTYIMPAPGAYRFGLFVLPAGGNLVHRFAVLRDESDRLWVDTNGNADFRDETPITDVNERTDVRALAVTAPRELKLAFVIARGAAPHIAHIYLARSEHNMMTMSVAAGSRTDDGLAYGVAPAARVLLVRSHTVQYRLRDLLEGYLHAIRRPDVDVLLDAYGIDVVPDTQADFAGLLFTRMIAAYGKPIFHSAGNWHQWLNSVSALGGVFSVGGSIGPSTFTALFGGGSIDGLMVHHSSAGGPADDGMLKPDFLAPMHRIAANLWGGSRNTEIPKNTPALQLPPGYQISCCTSASGPYAGGVGALLVSAAKQERLPYSVRTLGRALRVGSRFLDGWSAHQQGNGVLDINAAWRELATTVEIPDIRTSAPVAWPLADYSANGRRGPGLFETEGWIAGMTGRREFRFERRSGRREVVTYRVSWTGNDGTFATSSSIRLPLGMSVPLDVTISASAPGVHSTILNLHDPASDAIVFRTQATIVATERVDPRTHMLRLTGTVPLLRSRAHYVHVPDRVAAIGLDLEVIRGTLAIALVPGHGLYPLSHAQVYPQFGRMFTKGRYSVVLPRPTRGTWHLNLANISARVNVDRALVSTGAAEYAASLTLFDAGVSVRPSAAGALAIDIDNRQSELGEPVIETLDATRTSYKASFLATGLPNILEIDVPSGAETMRLDARSIGTAPPTLDLHLYDCTSGECFSYDYTLPASSANTMVVRRPKAGRWIAAVSPAPIPTTAGTFALDILIGNGRQQRTVAKHGARLPGARWTETIDMITPAAGRILIVELVDLALERSVIDRPWENREYYLQRSHAPHVVGSVVYSWSGGAAGRN